MTAAPSRADDWSQGWCMSARRTASPNFGPRPDGCAVSLVVLHAISLPPGVFGGPEVEQLFTNTLDPAAHPCFTSLAGLRVSAHFFLRRDGALTQFVSVEDRAWHAGVSAWRGRENCNDYSVGVELEGDDDTPYAEAQYAVLWALLAALRARYPVTDVAGHVHIAPGRKTDPGPCFDWPRLAARFPDLRLPDSILPS
ncbi:MAG: 1,6-anhydro-N-acetylmuramyl-L-alanine amidase AmpD [Zoogloeaceae bacterium]|jgi:AmpD protein|nr:1,6-anhydro-N-acetylmuramyl-L-alanine amidase AmpD [Zoogloeaceae bacterium]